MNETINLEAYQAYYNTNDSNLNKSMPNDAFSKTSGTNSKSNIEKRNSCDQKMNYPNNTGNFNNM